MPGYRLVGVRCAFAGPAVDFEGDAGVAAQPLLQADGGGDEGGVGGFGFGVGHYSGWAAEGGFVGEFDGLAFGEAAEHGGGAALLVDEGGVEDAVLDEFAGAVMFAEAPQIWAWQVSIVITPAVVGLQLEQHGRQAPVTPVVQSLDFQGVGGTGFEGKGWFSGLGVAGGDADGAGGEWVAVVQVLFEVQAAFAHVHDCNEVPGNAERPADGLVARLCGQHAVAPALDGAEVLLTDSREIE